MAADPRTLLYGESAVLGASPLRLVVLLYDEALRRIRRAGEGLRRGDPRGFGPDLNRASAILSELDRALDREAGGEIAANLASLYRFLITRVVEAGIRKDAGRLEGVVRILSTLRSGWDELSRRAA